MVKDKVGGASKCVFCRIGKRLTDTELLYWDNHIFVIRDARPKAPTHLLLIPFRHVKSLAYVNPGLEPRLGHVFMVAEEMARREGITLSGYRLILNQGPDAGQEVEHFHIHLLGGRPLDNGE